MPHALGTGATKFVLEPLPALGELERVWRELDHRGPHSFFLSWTWIGTVLRLAGHEPLLLKAADNGELTGLALLSLGHGTLRHLFPVRQAWLNATGDPERDGIMIEHNGFATALDNGADLLRGLVAWHAAGGLGVDELVLPGVDLDERPAPNLVVVEHRRRAYRAWLQELGGEGIFKVISRNARQNLRRSMRAYGESLVVDRAQDVDTALEYFDRLRDLHIRSWTRRGQRHAFATPFFETFHRALIDTGMADNTVDLLRVSAGNDVLGYLYNFRRNGVVSCYQSGFADDDPALRPGYVCHALAIARYAEAGLDCYDFLAGINRLKQSFGTDVYELSWRQYRRQKLVFRADDLVRRAGTWLRTR